EYLCEVRRIRRNSLLSNLDAGFGAFWRLHILVIHRASDQRRLGCVAGRGELRGADRVELERAFRWIGDNFHRSAGKRGLQLRICEVRNSLENREIRDHAEREPSQDDRLAADLVGQPPEDDKERSAERQRARDHDLGVDRRHFQGLSEEEQSIELAAVPDYGLTGGGAEQSQDRDLEVLPTTKGFRQRALGAFAFGLHALKHWRLGQTEPDP